MPSFYCLKLTTGETLLAEVIEVDQDYITLGDPFQVNIFEGESRDSISAVPWIPFTDSKRVKIKFSLVYFMDHMIPKFLKFYATMVLQSRIYAIKNDVVAATANTDVISSANSYYVMMAGIEEMKKAGEEIAEKFGVPSDVDVSSFEEAAAKYKPVMN